MTNGVQAGAFCRDKRHILPPHAGGDMLHATGTNTVPAGRSSRWQPGKETACAHSRVWRHLHNYFPCETFIGCNYCLAENRRFRKSRRRIPATRIFGRTAAAQLV